VICGIDIDEVCVKHLESLEQALIIEWSSYYPILKWLLHVPNGGSRTKTEAARLKREGVRAGVSDLFLPLPAGGYHGLWLELKKRKRDDGGKVSKNQSDFLEAMREQGYKAVVCYGADSAIRVIKEYAGI